MTIDGFVPYNMYLLKKYQAHINVECCNNTDVIKYLLNTSWRYLVAGTSPSNRLADSQQNLVLRVPTMTDNKVKQKAIEAVADIYVTL
jgi:hypothetical protein